MATMTEPKAEHKTLVHYLVEAGVAIIELDDPPANTYTFEMMRQLDEAILRARFDDGAHVVVLRGHGEKFFSAGAHRGQDARDRDDGEGRDVLVRQGQRAGPGERGLPRRRLLGAGDAVREAVHPTPQGVEGGRPDQAGGPIRRRGAVRVRADAGA